MMDENASQRADHFAELMKLHSKIEKLRFDLIQKDADLEKCQAQCDQQCKQLLREIQREVVDDDDEKLKQLRSELDEAAYEAVINALVEMNDYNPSGRYVVLAPGMLFYDLFLLYDHSQYLIKQVRSQKRKRKYS